MADDGFNLKIEIWTPDCDDDEFAHRVALTTVLVLKLLKEELDKDTE